MSIIVCNDEITNQIVISDYVDTLLIHYKILSNGRKTERTNFLSGKLDCLHSKEIRSNALNVLIL